MPEFEKIDVVEFLTKKIAAQIKIEVNNLSPDRDLHELGLSSLDAVMISGEMEDRFEVEIDPIIMFESRSINEVAEKVMHPDSE
jgi:acyl carrier protein